MKLALVGTIRAAIAEDWPLLQAIEVAAGERFREVGMDEIADADPPTVDDLRAAAAVLVAVDDDGAPIGYARLELVDGHAHLEQLSVVPGHGGRGVGTDLIDAAARWAMGRGDREITLTTFRDVPFNAPVYERRGFAVVPEAAWTDGLRALVAEESGHGLDPTARVVMRRPLAQ